jgi:aryl-phospho-beta-D-glucosidase BglC (GH1 family)
MDRSTKEDFMSLRRPSAAKWRSGLALCALLLASISAPTQAQLPTAQNVASQIRVGWNLGNTLEAQCGETAWGNPQVTQSFINSVKAAGFNAIRIPAAWNCHTNPAGSTTIDSAWMARVKAVVDYAYGQGMYVILNIHWDGGWLEEHPLYSYQTANNQRQQAFWTQIATTFQSYNERMMFAGTNEVHADYGTPTSEHIAVQQSYNQTFVNAVRATGGNNASRTLVVQTYNTNAWHGINYFSLPSDSIANRLMVEIHHYDPYDYTLNPSGACLSWGSSFPQYSQCSWAQEAYHTDLFSQVRTKWVAQGIPVIIGEWGVGGRSNLDYASREYYYEFLTRTAQQNGIKTFVWDIGVPTSQQGNALLDRNSGAIVDQGALNAIMRGVGGSTTTYAMTVSKSGSGSGTVASSPSGISCGSTCSTSFSSGTSVTLTATAASGSTFGGWGGACSGTSTSCTVSMSAARSVTATFNSSTTNYTLSVTKSGSGTGTVTSNTGGINCGSTCTATIASGTSVTLTASASSGSAFAGWGGACSGTGTCTTTMSQARTVTATFNTASTFALSVSRAGSGSGTVTSSPSGISCGSTCSANYSSGTSVTLTAAAASGSTFAGWSGACSGTGTCTTSMTASRSVTATFNTSSGTTYALSVTKSGSGSGTVTSNTGGINCGSTCSANVSSGTSVTLTAAAASGSTFAGWSGACSGTSTCTVSMTVARSVTATFNTSGGTGGTCSNPVTFTNNTGNFNTSGAVCYRTSQNIAGWGCSNFDGRTITVGGVARTCGQSSLTRSSDGYYYFAVSAGTYPWASLYVW